jgi:hypothetical protein
MKRTQKEIVKAKLLKEGKISNFWAFHNYLLRLGAVIYELRDEGMDIVGAFEKKNGKLTKNFVYTLVK